MLYTVVKVFEACLEIKIPQTQESTRQSWFHKHFFLSNFKLQHPLKLRSHTNTQAPVANAFLDSNVPTTMFEYSK